jgi:hypothetical protein
MRLQGKFGSAFLQRRVGWNVPLGLSAVEARHRRKSDCHVRRDKATLFQWVQDPLAIAPAGSNRGMGRYSRGVVSEKGLTVPRLAAGGSRIRTRGPTSNGIAVGRAQGNGRRLDLTLGASVGVPTSGLAARQNFRRAGTGSSNPVPSSGESGANSTPRFGHRRGSVRLGRTWRRLG